MSDSSDVFWQTCIGNAAHDKGSMGAEITHVLLHLLRPRGAVQAKDIDGERFKNRHHSSDIGSHQHRAGGLHRHAHHQWSPFARSIKGLLEASQCCLDLQWVLAGFDDEQINIAGQETSSLLSKGIAHLVKAHMPKRWQLCGRSHGASHEAWFLRRAVTISHFTG